MQNQRWRERRESYRPAGEVIRTSEYGVEEVSEPEAKAFIKTHHYAGDFPADRFRFGLKRFGRLVGVAVFSHPVNNRALTKEFPVHHLEATELGRLVLLDEVPANGESFFVARTFDALRRKPVVDRKTGQELRGILGVVSFSDPVRRRTSEGQVIAPGHTGCVYQALSACYVGRSDGRTLHLLPDGRVFNHRTEQKIRKREVGWRYGVEELRSYGADPVWDDPKAWLEHWLPRITRPLVHKGNHKYKWALHRSMRASLGASKPYPKQIDVEVGAASA